MPFWIERMNKSPANRTEGAVFERLSTLRVLAVDDHEINRQFLQAGLGPHVGSLMLAGNGYQAVKISRDHQFDLVLMDLHMPDMDGLSAWQKMLQESGPESVAKVIALTADSREEERERLRRAGFHGFLTKPVEIDRLLRTMVRIAAGGDGFESGDDEGGCRRSLLLDHDRARSASGSPHNARRMQAALLQELDQRKDELDGLMLSGAFDQAAEFLHQWKGGSGYAGASRLEQASALLEQSLRHGLDSSPGTLFVNFIRTTEATRQALALAVGSSNNPQDS